MVVLIVGAVLSPPLAWAGPGGTTPRCSQTEYRQSHLAECNRDGVGAPGSFPGGGGGGPSGGGGVLGLVGRVVRGIL